MERSIALLETIRQGGTAMGPVLTRRGRKSMGAAEREEVSKGMGGIGQVAGPRPNRSKPMKCQRRTKDGKEHHCYYTVEESRRLQSGKVVQRRILYPSEINDSQQTAWRKTQEVFDEQFAAVVYTPRVAPVMRRQNPLALVPRECAIASGSKGEACWKLLA